MAVCRCSGTGGGPRASKAEVGGVRDLLERWEFSPMLSGGESKTSLKPGHLLARARSPNVSKSQTCPTLSFSIACWPMGLVEGLLELLRNYYYGSENSRRLEGNSTKTQHCSAYLELNIVLDTVPYPSRQITSPEPAWPAGLSWDCSPMSAV